MKSVSGGAQANGTKQCTSFAIYIHVHDQESIIKIQVSACIRLGHSTGQKGQANPRPCIGDTRDQLHGQGWQLLKLHYGSCTQSSPLPPQKAVVYIIAGGLSSNPTFGTAFSHKKFERRDMRHSYVHKRNTN